MFLHIVFFRACRGGDCLCSPSPPSVCLPHFQVAAIVFFFLLTLFLLSALGNSLLAFDRYFFFLFHCLFQRSRTVSFGQCVCTEPENWLLAATIAFFFFVERQPGRRIEAAYRSSNQEALPTRPVKTPGPRACEWMFACLRHLTRFFLSFSPRYLVARTRGHYRQTNKQIQRNKQTP